MMAWASTPHDNANERTLIVMATVVYKGNNDDVITWKHFSHPWSFVIMSEIHRSWGNLAALFPGIDLILTRNHLAQF